MKPVVLDFETYAILPRPEYPPKPVGVAIKRPGCAAKYYAWGHPTGNNCTFAEAKRELKKAVSGKAPLLFHNAKFDIDVMEQHMGIKAPAWDKVHDTLFLLFLDDPHADNLSLKPSAERLLGLAPSERDAVGSWLTRHQPIAGIRMNDKPKGKNYYGKYIAYAPGGLVGAYAIGDIDRTEALFNLLHAKILKDGMGVAYDRERKLLPILLGMERRGIDIGTTRLGSDVAKFSAVKERIDSWIRVKTKSPNLDVGKAQQLVPALVKAKLVDKKLLGNTDKSGALQTNKDALRRAISDKPMLQALLYRAQLSTCLATFMEPWLKTAERSGGLIFTQWNQVRQSHGAGDMTGARTGRLSSAPNLQNIPKPFPAPVDEAKKAGLDLPALPLVRSYIIPPKGCVFIDRDYSQQELRILAHFEDGSLLQAYQADPWLDVHGHAGKMINSMLGKSYARGAIKNTGFGIIYGMGVGMLAVKNGCSVEEAREVKDAYLRTFPGLRGMYTDMKQRAASNEPFRTWGGRAVYCEPAKLVDGVFRTYDYKMVNYLVQGSAADCTKEAIIKYAEQRPPAHILLLNVHDQLLCAVPKREVKRGMGILKKAMESVVFSLPMLTDGKCSPENWAALKTYDKRGELV